MDMKHSSLNPDTVINSVWQLTHNTLQTTVPTSILAPMNCSSA